MKQKMRSSRKTLLLCIALVMSSALLAQETEKANKETSQEFVGQYIYDNKAEFGKDITITYDKAYGLEAQPTDGSQPKTEMMALGKDEFELLKTGGLIATFKRDEKGKIISVTISKGSKAFTCIKK